MRWLDWVILVKSYCYSRRLWLHRRSNILHFRDLYFGTMYLQEIVLCAGYCERLFLGQTIIGEWLCNHSIAGRIHGKCPPFHFWDILSHPPVHWHRNALSKIEYELWWCRKMDCESYSQCSVGCQDRFEDGHCCYGHSISEYVRDFFTHLRALRSFFDPWFFGRMSSVGLCRDVIFQTKLAFWDVFSCFNEIFASIALNL